MPSLFTALKQYLRDAAPGGVLSPEAEPIAQYGRKVRGNVQGLLDDPAAFAKSAVLDVVPNRDESNAVLSQLMGRPYDQNMSRAYLDKMIDMGGLLGSIKALHHGSTGLIKKFDPQRLGSNTGADDAKIGFHFAESFSDADLYARMAAEKAGRDDGGVVGRYLVRSKNPLVLGIDNKGPVRGRQLERLLRDKVAAREYAERAGYDSLIYPQGTRVDSDYTLVTWTPENIRLAKKQRGGLLPE